MDLVDVLSESSVTARNNDLAVTLGHKVLDAYYADIHGRFLNGTGGQLLVRAALNFAVQQLAAPSGGPERERYLQVGSLDASDLAAGLINATPHTHAEWIPGFTGVTSSDVAQAVDAVRADLPGDSLPQVVAISDQPWRELAAGSPAGVFGLITVFSDRGAHDLPDCVAALRPLTHDHGRLVVFEALSGGRRPTGFPAAEFVGRYLMTGPGPARTLAIAVLRGGRQPA